MSYYTQVTSVVYILAISGAINYFALTDEIVQTPNDLKVQDTHLLDASINQLLNKTGHLVETGWHPHPIKVFDEKKFYPVNAGFKPLTFLKFKQFEFHQVISGDIMMFLALADNGSYSGSVFLYVYNYATNEVQVDRAVLMPWQLSNLKLNVQNSMKFGKSLRFKYGGLQIEYNDLSSGPNKPIKRQYKIKSESINFETDFVIELEKNKDSEDGILHDLPKDEGFLLAQKIDEEGKHWCMLYKHYGMQPTGTMQYQGQKLTLSKENKSVLMFDYNTGLFQYKTHWLWCTANSVTKNGDRIAFNFSNGIPKHSTNKAQENYLVKNGKVHLLDSIDFKYKLGTTNPWQIRTIDSNAQTQVSQDLSVGNSTGENVNFGIVKNTLTYHMGSYNGSIKIGDEVYEIELMKGLCEFNYVQW